MPPLLLLSLLLLVTLTPTPTSTQTATTSPSIVVIMADDLGWNDVGFRDSEMVTPNIDSLAKEGVVLKHSYMQQVCTPSRAAMFTGYYPFRMGMQHSVLAALDNDSLPLKYRLFPQDLQDQGYSTHFVGKWHLGFCRLEMTPTYRGFNTFYGKYTGKSDHYTHISKWNGYDLQDNKGQGSSRNFTVDWSGKGKYSTDLFTDRAVDIVKKHDVKKPLFLFLSYQAVHGPMQVPEDYVTRLCANVSVGGRDRKVHCAMTAAMDEGIGKVMKALKDKGIADNLITLFVADNGGAVKHNSSNWPLRGSKITLWEGGTRVVTVLHSKKHLPKAPYTWTGLMHAVDWYPTLLSAAGKNISGTDGVDNWQSIVNNSASQRTEFLYNVNDVRDNGALRMGDYKLIYKTGAKPDAWYNPPAGVSNNRTVPPKSGNDYLLFNVVKDPGELNDLYDDSSLADVKKTMRRKLRKFWKKMVPTVARQKVEAAKPRYHNGAWVTGWC